MGKRGPYKKHDPAMIAKGIAMIRRGVKRCKAAEAVGIPVRTLSNKYDETHPLKPGRQTIFTPAEENRILTHLEAMQKVGFPLTQAKLMETANEILQEDPRKNLLENGAVTEGWAKSILKRHSDRMSKRKPGRVSGGQAAVTTKSLKHWHRFMVETINKLPGCGNIWNEPERFLNFDEWFAPFDGATGRAKKVKI